MTNFTKDDARKIQSDGTKMYLLPNVTFMLNQREAFTVDGQPGKPGDYVAFDPIQNKVWIEDAKYVSDNYRPANSGSLIER